MVNQSPSSDDRSEDEHKRGPRSKVSRIIDRYELTGVGQYLENRWTEDSGSRASLRELADEFNQRLLETELQANGKNPLDGEVKNLYRLLTDDDVSSGSRTKAEHRLRRTGIEIDQLREDFVSHRAIHTYLTKYRGATPPTESDDQVPSREKRARNLRELLSRVERVADNDVSKLDTAGDITVGTFDVYAEVQIHCTDCSTQYDVHELLERGSCQCT